MGLLIESTKEKTITITGTEIALPLVYGRIEFAARANGKTLEIAIGTYASRAAFESGAGQMFTDVPQGNITVELQPGEIQGLETAHIYAQSAFEQMGYNVTIQM
jgi:stringent starvation protein B